MSHFVTWVLVPAGKATKREVERLLKPFDERAEVDPYQDECHCVGRKAQNDARAKAEKAESIDQIRTRFAKIPRVVELSEFGDDWEPKKGVAVAAWRKACRERDALWKAEIDVLHAREQAALAKHKDKDKPDPKCDECKGTGKVTSTYNPKSKWDWWVIGGRWAGEITKVGVPDDENPFITGDRASADRKRATREAFEINSCVVSEINLPPVGDYNDENKYVHFPYAIVTPDGEWHGKGEMGWFGCSSGDKEDWPGEARRLLSKHADCIAVACDLHI